MNEWGIVLSLIGVWGWIATLFLFIFKSFPERGRFNGKPASIWGGLAIIFWGCWMLGMLAA